MRKCRKMRTEIHLYKEFSVSTLHELEKKVENLSDSISAKLKCRKLEDLTLDSFRPKSVTKEILASIVLEMRSMICDSKSVLRFSK